MPFSAKDLELLNARSQFQRAFYDAPAVRPSEYLKDPARFGGTPVTSSAPPVTSAPKVVNAVNAATRLEQGLTTVRSLPNITAPMPPTAASSPLREAIASAIKSPLFPPSKSALSNAISAGAARVAPTLSSAAASLSTPLAGAAGLLYSPAKSLRDAELEFEKNLIDKKYPGYGKAYQDALNAASPIFGGQVPPWLNPLNWIAGKPKTGFNGGNESSFEVPIKNAANGVFSVSYHLSTSRKLNGIFVTDPPVDTTISKVGTPISLIYSASGNLKKLSVKYVEGRPESFQYGQVVISDLITGNQGEDSKVLSLTGTISAGSGEPDYPREPSQAPSAPGFYNPPLVALSPKSLQESPTTSPGAAPSPTTAPEKTPTLDPKTAPFPVPAPNRPKDEEKKPAPIIPPLPFIPLLPAKAPNSANQPGGKSLTNPTESPVANPGTGMSGAKPPNVPPVASAPRCRDKCSQAIQDKVDGLGDKLEKGVPLLGTAGQAIDLQILNTINNKLGEQLPDGIGGKLTRLSEWLHLDRLMNLMTLSATLHNAYFLSSGLSQTLFSMISNTLAVVGIKNAEGNPIDIASLVNSSIENFAKSILGVQAVDGIKAEWKQFSRVYQAAANIVWSIQSIGQSILSVLEIVGSNVAKIGNALRKWGVVGERAFGWMNAQPNFQNRFFTGLERVQDVTSQLDGVASNTLSAQQTVDQLFQQKDDLLKSVSEATGSKQGSESPEAAKKKEAESNAKIHSVSPVITTESQTKPETNL